jgi:tetratricopeptide (TPR) repeat protein
VATATAVAAFVILFIWVNRPLPVDDGVTEERTRMAERLITLGRYGEAEPWAERAEHGDPRPGVLHFRLGQRLLARVQPDFAIANFEKALRFDPGRPEVEYMLGETLLDARRPQDAIPHLRRALDAGFQPETTGYDLVRALGAAGDRTGAIGVLKNVRPARMDDAERWVALGDLGMQLEEPGLSETFFRRAIAIRPDLASAQFGLGVVCANTGRMSEARIHAQEALRLDPGSERAKRLRDALSGP